jgi:alpha-L-fucosidase 2
MAEMLVQSHNGYIEFLPALPSAWENGEVNGLFARGGFVVDIKWKGQRFSEASVKSISGGECFIRTNVPVRIKEMDAESKQTKEGFILSFSSVKGKIYKIATVSSD